MGMDARSTEFKTGSGDRPYVLLFFIQRILFRTSFDLVDPLGLMALAAFIEEKGYQPGVFTGTVTEAVAVLDKEAATRRVSAVGLYCDFENCSVVESFSRYVKDRWGMPVVIGGPQAAALDRAFMISSGCDALARGEGEYTLWELLEYLVRGSGNRRSIAGISYLDQNGVVVVNPDRSLIRDLDALPFQRSSHSLTRRKNNLSVLTGRGCPFQCAFCHEGAGSKTVRTRSVENVMDEIRQALEENPEARYVWFADDTFTLSPARIARFCDAIGELKAHRDFVWFCEGHPSILVKWPHIVQRMVEAGLVRMQIGIETGSRRVIDLYRKQTSLEQIEEVVRICGEAKLAQLCGNIIVGGALESSDTLEETQEYVDRLLSIAPGMLDVSLTLFMPFPCTAITLSPERFGMTICDSEALTSVADYPVVRTEEMGLNEITAARGDFSRKIVKGMRRLLGAGRVAHEDILRHYCLNLEYGISSIWYTGVYSQQRLLHRRYQLLARSDARRMQDIPAGESMSWRPLRVFSLWNGIAWRGDIPEVERHVLSPIEYDLLLLCSGKIQLREVVDVIGQKFTHCQTREGAEQMVLKLLREFEERHWLVFVPH